MNFLIFGVVVGITLAIFGIYQEYLTNILLSNQKSETYENRKLKFESNEKKTFNNSFSKIDELNEYLVKLKESSKSNKEKKLFDEIQSFISSKTRNELNDRPSNTTNLISNSMKNLSYQEESTRCPYGFKVFVYPVNVTTPSFARAEEARKNNSLHVCRRCILEQFSLEYILYDFFTQSCVRTLNPDDADYYYMPMLRDAEYRINLHNNNNRDSSFIEEMILDMLDLSKNNNNNKHYKEYKEKDIKLNEIYKKIIKY